MSEGNEINDLATRPRKLLDRLFGTSPAALSLRFLVAGVIYVIAILGLNQQNLDMAIVHVMSMGFAICIMPTKADFARAFKVSSPFDTKVSGWLVVPILLALVFAALAIPPTNSLAERLTLAAASLGCLYGTYRYVLNQCQKGSGP